MLQANNDPHLDVKITFLFRRGVTGTGRGPIDPEVRVSALSGDPEVPLKSSLSSDCPGNGSMLLDRMCCML